MENFDKDNLIFALDIGTRSVIGIVGYQKEDIFHVCATEKELYKKRVVVDGQIEDVEKTALTAEIVKLKLEEKVGVTLKNVHIAAAGRTLRTVEVTAQLNIEEEIIDEKFVKKLEYVAIGNAYEQINAQEDGIFYCAGSAVQKYILDGYEISTLLNHKGKKAEVQMIATFLPEAVVETLYTTMRRIGLTVSTLTLEPIAAMNALIPPDLRKLNLTLCDVGAGTADIAVCKDGTVSGYTMATIAGDEVTEAIMQECLVDFQMAEKIKFNVSEAMAHEPDFTVEYQDILGIPHEETAKEICTKISSTIEKLADTICKKVLDTNGKPPVAMFLVGGGSQTPMLRQLVAEGLTMDISKVAVGGNVYMKKLAQCDENIYIPEYATPLGIALTAAMENQIDTFSVTINKEKIRLFNTWDTTALGVLQMSGYRYSQIMGQNGKVTTYYLNGEQKTVRGGIPTSADIKINGNKCALSDIVRPGDVIEFTPAQAGANEEITIKKIVEDNQGFLVYLNGEVHTIKFEVQVNGMLVDENTIVKSGDKVTLAKKIALGEFLEPFYHISALQEVLVNGIIENETYFLQPEDVIEAILLEDEEEIILDQPIITQQATKIAIVAEEQPTVNGDTGFSMYEKNIFVTLNGEIVELKPKDDGSVYQFFDLLAYVEIDLKTPQGILVQTLNGRQASYLSVLNDGDKAEIYWAN